MDDLLKLVIPEEKIIQPKITRRYTVHEMTISPKSEGHVANMSHAIATQLSK